MGLPEECDRYNCRGPSVMQTAIDFFTREEDFIKMSEPDELEQELEEFKSKLSQTRDKFINKWMDEDWRKIVQEKNKKHEDFVKKGNEEINNHNAKLEELKQQKQEYLKGLENRVEKLEKMKANLNLFADKADDGELSAPKKSKTTETSDKPQELADLEKEAALFRENLGFSFKKTAGGRIQFVFTAIDRDDPDAPFYFYVKLDESRKYIVSDCEPLVHGLEDMVKKLNETNNLSAFVVTMRKAFKNISVTEKEKQQKQ